MENFTYFHFSPLIYPSISIIYFFSLLVYNRLIVLYDLVSKGCYMEHNIIRYTVEKRLPK